MIQRTLSGSGIAQAEVTSYTWDLAGRLLGHNTNAGGQPHATSYQYDAAGRLAARKVQAGSQTDLITQRYGYDSVERLAQIKYLKAEGQAGEQLIEQLDYSYDAAGRRTSKTALNNNGIGQGETPMSATYDAANRMTALTLTVGAATKTYALSYDAAGNLTQKQNTVDATDKTSYTWDASNRLSQIAQTGATTANTLNASFTYDAFGRRIQSSIATGGNPAQTVQYLYEGQQALGEIRNGQLSHRLLTGLSLDETIARIAIASSGQKDAANSRVFMTDVLNSVIAQLSDDNATAGGIQNSYGYSPYGEAVTVGPDAAKNPVQYTSRENDGTGLMFYRARYYDPVLKRFISSDPIGLGGGLNMYAYVEGNPLSMTDAMGLMGGGGNHAACSCPQPPKMPGPANSCSRESEVDRNIKEASSMGLVPFYQAVRNKGRWDYKQQGGEYQDFGNFNFGATGYAAGLGPILLPGAGWAQSRAGTSKPGWGNWYGKAPYGDDPADQAMILEGMRYARCGCGQ